MTYKHPATATGWSLVNAADAAGARTAINANLGIDVRDHGAVGDAVAIFLAGTTLGSAVVTSPDNLFTPDMVGKTIVVSGANADDSALVSTVASYQSPGQITMADTVGKVSSLIRVNAIVGTDNSEAFADAFAEAAAGTSGLSISLKNMASIKPVIVPPGKFLTLTGVPTLQVRGHALVGSGFGATQIWHCGTGPFLELGEFDPTATTPTGTANYAWYGFTSWGLKVSDLELSAPIFGRDQVPSRRVGVGIQDNGGGHLFVEDCWIYGFNYGIYATSGSDFSEIRGRCNFSDNNVGIYFGPGSEQITMTGPIIIGRNREGIVVEGAPNAVIVGVSLGDSAIADVVFEGKASGTTRAGYALNMTGAAYFGPWLFLNCWFETASAGSEENMGPQHILIDSQRALSPGIPKGWEGVTFQDCILVSGGTQVVGDTKAFIHDKSLYPANPKISNLVVGGQRINTIYRYSGPAASFSPVIEGGMIGFSSDISKFMGPNGVAAPVQTSLPGVIDSPNRLTLSKANIDDSIITSGTLTTPRIQNSIQDSSGNNILGFTPISNAVNYVNLRNSATTSAPRIEPLGSDTNVALALTTKGNGLLYLSPGNTPNLELYQTTSAVNYFRMGGATTGNDPTLNANGSDTNVSLNLTTKGTGVVKANGVPVVRRNIQTVTTATTLGANGDYVVFISGANGAVTLPTAVDNTGRYTLKNIHTENKTVSTTSSQTIDGGSLTILPGDSVDLISDGTNWRIV